MRIRPRRELCWRLLTPSWRDDAIGSCGEVNGASGFLARVCHPSPNDRKGSCVTSALSRVLVALNCTRDEGGPFEFGNQVLISSHRKLLWSKAMVVSVAEKSGHDPVRQG